MIVKNTRTISPKTFLLIRAVQYWGQCHNDEIGNIWINVNFADVVTFHLVNFSLERLGHVIHSEAGKVNWWETDRGQLIHETLARTITKHLYNTDQSISALEEQLRNIYTTQSVSVY